MDRNYSIPTGLIVKEYLDAYGISQLELSKRIDVSPKHICNLLKGKTSLTEDIALKLEKVLPNVSASFLMSLEADHKLFLAKEKEAEKLLTGDLAEISKKFNFNEVFKGLKWSVEKQAVEMLKILQISNYDNFNSIYANNEIKFLEDGGSLESIVVWLKLCEKEIDIVNENVGSVSFSKTVLENNLDKFKALAYSDNIEKNIKNLQQLCNSLGIYLVVMDAVKNSKVRGATTVYKKHPAIYLSRRFKTHDNFWFAFFHEIGHIILHYDGVETFVSFAEEEVETKNDKFENEANNFARDILIDNYSYENYILKKDFSVASIKRLAIENKVLPGIVVARLQHDRIIDFSDFNYLKVKIN